MFELLCILRGRFVTPLSGADGQSPRPSWGRYRRFTLLLMPFGGSAAIAESPKNAEIGSYETPSLYMIHRLTEPAVG